MAKVSKGHSVHPNRVKLNFKCKKLLHVSLMEITSLKYGQNQTTYLSNILDATMNEIMAYEVSNYLKMIVSLKS